VTPEGNVEGKHVLHRLGEGQPLQERESEESVLKAARGKLLAARNARTRPERDENILTSWNAMMISALFDAAATFGVSAYRAAAEKALTFLLDYACAHGRVYRTVAGGQGRLNGYLDDAAWLATALLDAFEATAHRWYLDQALAVTESFLSQFWDGAGGGCFFTSHDHEPLLQRMKTGTDGALPSGNAVSASVLLRLFSFTGEQRYHEQAGQTLKAFQSVMDENPYSSAALLCTLDWWLTGGKEIVILGSREHAVKEAMVNVVQQRYIPNRVVMNVDETALSSLSDLSLMQGKALIGGRPTVYVCHRQTCSPPLTEVPPLEGML
jgi:uncharacterized protein YyaL (SSP411 family)